MADFLQFKEGASHQAFNLLVNNALSQSEELWKINKSANPSLGFEKTLADRSAFSAELRNDLVEVLKEQYKDIADGWFIQQIESLKNANTFTVTTGQQIHILGGPWYVWYKVLSTIRLAHKLKAENPSNHYIPIFWMATEDHDMDEISEIQWWGKKFLWDSKHEGASGSASVDSLEIVFSQMEQTFGSRLLDHLDWKKIRNCYDSSSNLADASRKLFHYLLGEKGLVCIDANHPKLKKYAKDLFIKDIHGKFNEEVQKQTQLLKSLGYTTRINIRNTHLFYLTNNKRIRIEQKNHDEFESQGIKKWSKEEIINEINQYPERFSPNVLLRPFYQEGILPNLAYVAGPAEMEYWFQILPAIQKYTMVETKLIMRESWVQMPSKYKDIEDKLGISITELFLDLEQLKQKLIAHLKQKYPLEMRINSIKENANDINNMLYMLKYSKQKLVKESLEEMVKNLEKRLRDIENEWLEIPDIAEKMTLLQKIKGMYFDGNNPQERNEHFLSGKYELLAEMDIEINKNYIMPNGVVFF